MWIHVTHLVCVQLAGADVRSVEAAAGAVPQLHTQPVGLTYVSDMYYMLSSPGNYVGVWQDGHPHGPWARFDCGDWIFVGAWKDPLPDGRGEITWADSRKYVGDLKRGKPDGFGFGIDVDGAILYKGMWKEGNSADGLVSPQGDSDWGGAGPADASALP